MEAILESNFTCVICTAVTLGVKQASCCSATLCTACVTKTKGNPCCQCRNTTYIMSKNRGMYEMLETCRRTCTDCKLDLNIIALKGHLCQAKITQLPTITLAADYESLLHGATYKCTLAKPHGSLLGEHVLIGKASATIRSVCDDDVVVVYLPDTEKYVRLSLHAAHHLVVERQDAEKRAKDTMRRVEATELDRMLDSDVDSDVDSEDYDDPMTTSAVRPAIIDVDSDDDAPPAQWTSLSVADMTGEERSMMMNSVLSENVLVEVLPRRSLGAGVVWKLVLIQQRGSDRRYYVAPFYRVSTRRIPSSTVRVPFSRNIRTRRQLVPRDFTRQ
ncbi:hypothetical protein SARC_00062 [Sphaeroforma arctica JP610]|uniref:Uncharacterized protein n=1 Tax=Sphaeroforma arctica JP610 TaxID=667725 RepID=A0A0L0GFF3_9EUKA|nr:hypothetical protein SARC_00062 [Sphaeroforma arctica JP610]KNC87805.1 hypothetical protein SARC_00062 [Sphaeroforma arctica JP610]|eukprot:XP_014161707.1 hypothetical protein SARC_00062 [Sphaeroforma arctica JP610]